MSHNKPSLDQLKRRYGCCECRDAVRVVMLSAARSLVDLTPCCEEQKRALEALDQAMFLFEAALTRHESHP